MEAPSKFFGRGLERRRSDSDAVAPSASARAAEALTRRRSAPSATAARSATAPRGALPVAVAVAAPTREADRTRFPKHVCVLARICTRALVGATEASAPLAALHRRGRDAADGGGGGASLELPVSVHSVAKEVQRSAEEASVWVAAGAGGRPVCLPPPRAEVSKSRARVRTLVRRTCRQADHTEVGEGRAMG